MLRLLGVNCEIFDGRWSDIMLGRRVALPLLRAV